MTDEQAAHNVVKQVRASVPDIWLGMRQRQVLEDAIAAALADRERAVWDKVEAMLERKPLLMPLNKEAISFNKALKDEIAKLRQQANGEKNVTPTNT